jgi:hypothetical protein
MLIVACSILFFSSRYLLISDFQCWGSLLFALLDPQRAPNGTSLSCYMPYRGTTISRTHTQVILGFNSYRWSADGAAKNMLPPFSFFIAAIDCIRRADFGDMYGVY